MPNDFTLVEAPELTGRLSFDYLNLSQRPPGLATAFCTRSEAVQQHIPPPEALASGALLDDATARTSIPAHWQVMSRRERTQAEISGRQAGSLGPAPGDGAG